MIRINMMKELTLALSKAKAEYPQIDCNRQANYGSYADLENIMDAIQPILTKYGLDISHEPDFCKETKIKWLKSTVAHVNGGERVCKIMLETQDNKAASFGSALSYAKRQATNALLGVNPSKEPTDNDGAEELITLDQAKYIEQQLTGYADIRTRLLNAYNIQKIEHLDKSMYKEVVDKIDVVKKAPK
jgi:hypothetical protein